ncbi:MAG: winged helix-turn-helix domain-containing protein [Haloferacaceae archaeon]
MDETLPISPIREHGDSIDEAFQLLTDDTRLAIMQALWEAHDPMDPTPMTFTDIREQVGVDDPGRLNYHLGELTTHFVRRTEDGYEFREAGKRVMRVVISGTAIDSVTIEPTEIDVSCIFCGGPTEISYEDGLLSHRCLQCTSRCVADYPPSLLSREELPPAGLLDRTINEVYPSNRLWVKHRETSVMDGVCPECAGPMPVESVRICGDHRPDPTDEEVCDGCGSIFWGVVHHVCGVCKFHMQLPTSHYPPTHPAVLAFYYDHGIEFDLASHEQRTHLLEYQEEVVSEDPLRIRTTIPLDGDELHVTFDEQMTVVDVSR